MPCKRRLALIVLALLVALLALGPALAFAQPGPVTNVSVFARASGEGFQTHGMTIPPGPLLFADADRLATARARYAASPSTYGIVSPTGGTQMRVLQIAYVYLMTQTPTSGASFTGMNATMDTTDDAIAWLLNTIDCGGGCRNDMLYPGGQMNASLADYRSQDDYPRYYGQIVVLSYSWLRPLMTSDQRQAFLVRLTRAVASVANETWGAPDDEGNNYNWGHARNLFLAGALYAAQERGQPYPPPTDNCDWATGAGATDMEVCDDDVDTLIDKFFDDALDVRYARMHTYLDGVMAGGAMPEGQNYGHYLLDYFMLPLWLMRDYGLDHYTGTSYWREAAWMQLYCMSTRPMYANNPSASIGGGISQPWYTCPTYGNTQGVFGQPYVGEFEEGGFMTMVAVFDDGTELGDHARWWLTTVQPKLVGFVKVLDGERGAAGHDRTDLPLALCANGPKFCYIRDTWATNAKPMQWALWGQNIQNNGGNHPDCSILEFQITRDQRHLTKETAVAFDRWITNLTGDGAVSGGQFLAHNTFQIDDATTTFPEGYCVSPNSSTPVVSRLQYHTGGAGADDDFFFMASDATDALQENLASPSGAAVVAAARDFLVIPLIDTLCVFDRIQTTTDRTKNQFVHFTNAPTQDGDIWTGTNSTEALRLLVLNNEIGANTTTYTVRNEGDFTGSTSGTSCGASRPSTDCDTQRRLELRTTGSTASYMPMCLQGYTTGDELVSAGVSEDATTVTIDLARGTDNVSIVFVKGATSTGGSVTINGTSTSFAATVQTMAVGDAALPRWN